MEKLRYLSVDDKKFFAQAPIILSENLNQLFKRGKLSISDLRKIYKFEIERGLNREQKFNASFVKWALTKYLLFERCKREYQQVIGGRFYGKN